MAGVGELPNAEHGNRGEDRIVPIAQCISERVVHIEAHPRVAQRDEPRETFYGIVIAE